MEILFKPGGIMVVLSDLTDFIKRLRKLRKKKAIHMLLQRNKDEDGTYYLIVSEEKDLEAEPALKEGDRYYRYKFSSTQRIELVTLIYEIIEDYPFFGYRTVQTEKMKECDVWEIPVPK